MSNIAIPNSFTAYTVAASAEVNANFTEIQTKFNTYAVQKDVAATITAIHTYSTAPVFGFATASQALELDAGKAVQSVAITGTGNYVKSASPTFTGTIIGAAMTLSGAFQTATATVTGTLTLPAGDDVLVQSGVKRGAIAQVSGAAAGFNIFTPTDQVSYYLVVAGQDVASGTATHAFVDVLVVKRSGAVAHVVLSSTSAKGTPGARTYSDSTGQLRVALASGTTWYVDVATMKFSS